jgi:hypothetical protein
MIGQSESQGQTIQVQVGRDYRALAVPLPAGGVGQGGLDYWRVRVPRPTETAETIGSESMRDYWRRLCYWPVPPGPGGGGDLPPTSETQSLPAGPDYWLRGRTIGRVYSRLAGLLAPSRETLSRLLASPGIASGPAPSLSRPG